MNCRPGDIARIVHPSMYGTLVEVLHAAPLHEFTMPDGYLHEPCGPSDWVFVILGQPARAERSNGSVILTKYAACHDRWLRPIRDQDGEDEMLRIAGKPEPLSAPQPVEAV